MVFLILLGLVTGPLLGQGALSVIRGTVTDQTGAVVPGVEVTVTDVRTNVRIRAVISSDSGHYEVPDVHPGTYRIRAELPGFKAFVADNVVLEGAQTRRVDVMLQVGEATDEVIVEAGAAVITTDSAEISSGFTDKLFETSPLVRTYYPQSLMTTLPGIESQMGSWALRMAGQPTSQVAENMDGIWTNDGTVNLINNMLMFNELKVTPVGNKADQARVASFNMVSKRGDSGFHGSAFWTHLNSALAARHFFEPEKPVLIEHKFFVEASGPIFKDRTFFYASYMHQNLPAGSFQRSTVPTLLMRQGDFSQVSATVRDPLTGEPFPNNIIPSERFNPTSLLVQDLFIPEPNLGGPDALVNNVGFEHAYPDDLFRADYPMVRIDHQITDKNSIYGRYIRRYTPYVLKRGLPGFDWTRVRWHRGTTVSNTHVFSPAMVNTFRFGWMWDFIEDGIEVDGFTPRPGDEVVRQIGLQGVNPGGHSVQGFPRMNITGMTPLETVAGGVAGDNHSFTFGESLTWSKGDHVWKFGADIKRVSTFNGKIPEANYGIFGFNGSLSGHPYADFLLGLPFSSQRLDPLTDRTQVAWENGLYVMDTYKVSQRLTLDYGLRWDIFTSPSYKDGLQFNWDLETGNVIVPSGATSAISPLYPPNITIVEGQVEPDVKLTNFQPRFGVAYRIRDQMVIRGGYGSFTEQIGYFDRLQGGGPFQIAESYSPNRIVDGQPLWAFPNPFPASLASAALPSQSIRGFPMRTNNGRIHQFNVSLERQVRDIGFRASYVGSRSRGLNYNVNINKPEPSLTPFDQSRRPFSQFVGATWSFEDGASNYDSFQFHVTRKAGAFTFDAHYTLQNNLSNFLNLENPYDRLHWNRESFAAREKFVVNTIIELPWGRGRRYLADAPGWLDHFVGGWQLVTVSHFQSGQWFSPSFSGSDPSGTNTTSGRPDRICDGNLPSSQRTVERWFDFSCFTDPQPGRFGNAGVNILEGPGLNLHHMSVLKAFSVREGLKFEYVASISNLFNRPHFQFPRSNISAAAPGEITGNRNFNQDQNKAGARMMEMTLRLRW